MSTVDDLLDFGSSGQHGNSVSNDVSWKATSNVDLLGDFDSAEKQGEFEFNMSNQVHSDEEKEVAEEPALGFHSAQDSCRDDDPVESKDGSGFAYEGIVVGDSEELLRDPSPELHSSRPVAESSAAFDNLEGGGEEMCRSCEKRVYQMERLIADKHIYHKNCFKCSKCKRILSVGNFAVNNNELYCKPHMLELFKYRGRYDDGPGMENNSSSYCPDHQVAKKRAERERRTEEAPAVDVIRSDEKYDDGITSAPNLSNIRSRFEASEEAKEPEAKEPVARRSPGKQTSPQILDFQHNSERRPSEEVRVEELPPENMTRSLAAKFREMESNQTVEQPRMSPKAERRAGGLTQTDSAMDPERPVIRETDSNDVLPEAGTTRNLVSVWKNLETTDGSPAPRHRSTPEATRRPSAQRVEERRPSASPPAEVVRCGEAQAEDELPPPNTARSMAAIFRSLESQGSGGPPPTPESSKRLQARARENSGANNTVRLPGGSSGLSSCYDEEPPLRHQNGNGDLGSDETVENEPLELDPNVVRNRDPSSTEELPERGTTRNLLAIFKSMEQAERA